MKKILLTISVLLLAHLANAQFVVSAQLGGAFSRGSSAFESVYTGPSPVTGLDTVITDTGSHKFDKPISASIGLKFGYQMGKLQFGIAGMFAYSRISGNFSVEEFTRLHPTIEAVRVKPPHDSLVANYSQYQTAFSVSPYLRYELIQMRDLAFFAELNAYYSKTNYSHRHEFLDWYRLEMHHTIDTSYTIPESTVSIGAKITPGLSWQLSPKCCIDLYLDIIAFSFDKSVYTKTTVVEEYDYTTTPRVLSRVTTTDLTATTRQIGFGIAGSSLFSERNWIRVGFNYTF